MLVDNGKWNCCFGSKLRLALPCCLAIRLLGLTAWESGSLSKINPAVETAVGVPPFIVPECVVEQP